MQIQQTERFFRYSGLVLPDPNSSLGIEAADLRFIVSGNYHGWVSGPELVDGKQVFTFKAAVGTKA